MDLKKMFAIIVGLGAVYLVSSKIMSRKPPAKEYERLADSISLVACSDEVQKQIPAEAPQPASSNFNDGIQKMAESDPRAAAQIENLMASVTPEKAPESPYNSEQLLHTFAAGLQGNGWSKEYTHKLIAAKSPEELKQLSATVVLKMKAQCPNASPKTEELLGEAFTAFQNSKD